MKILLAIDGSKFSDSTTTALATQIPPQGAEVLVLQVVEPNTFSTPPQMAEGYAPEQDERLKAEFDQAREAVRRASQTLRDAGFVSNTRVIEAETRTAILEIAGEWQTDLIVVGSHGKSGLRRFLLGSVAQSVARNAKCSVLIVRTP